MIRNWWLLPQQSGLDRYSSELSLNKVELLEKHIEGTARKLEEVSSMVQELELMLAELLNFIRMKSQKET